MQRILSGMCLILEFIHRGFRFHGILDITTAVMPPPKINVNMIGLCLLKHFNRWKFFANLILFNAKLDFPTLH